MNIIPMLFSVAAILGTALWVWMFVDCVANEASSGNNKLFWLLIIVFAPMIGALSYFVVRRPNRIATRGR